MPFDPVSLGIDVVGGALNSLLGGGRPKQSAEQRAQYQLLNKIGQQLYSQSQQAPMSQPGEMQALAQDRGILGQQQRNQLASSYTQMAPNQPGFLNDFLRNISAQQTGQQMVLDEQHMMDALARRREALLQAASVSEGAFRAAPPGTPGTDISGLLAGLGQALAYRKHINNGGTPPPVGTPYNNQGDITAPSVSATPLGPPVPAGMGDRSGAGDDPLAAAILALLKAHGWRPGRKKRKVGDDPQMAALAQLMGQAPATGGMMGSQPMGQGAAAPGNEPGGQNGIANQIRQSGGYGLRVMRGPNGTVFAY